MKLSTPTWRSCRSALLKDVAREAGELSLEWLRRGAKSWDKSADNPVTEADIAVNDLIAKRLRSARPEYGWLSEETRTTPPTAHRARCGSSIPSTAPGLS